MKVILSRNDRALKWGFRLKGGKDFGIPLTVESVAAGQIASLSGLVNGDFITKINSQSTKYMKHYEAQNLIRDSGNKIDIEISRGGLYPQYSPSTSTENLDLDTGDVFDDDHKSPTFESEKVPNIRRPSLPMPTPFQLQSAQPKSSQNDSPRNNKTDINNEQTKDTTKQTCSGVLPSFSKTNTSPENSFAQFKKTSYQPSGPTTSSLTTKQHEVSQPQNQLKTNKVDITGLVGKIKDLQTKPAAGKQSLCKICRQVIQGMFYSTDTGIYCKDHFKCSACCIPLVNMEFLEKEGFLWCKDDYLKRFAEICAQCGQPISGNLISALGKQWHARCFVCNTCHQQIMSSSFRVNDDHKPVCDVCWKTHFQKMCARCKKPIEGIDWYQEANGKEYHSTCFTCTVCSETLKAKVFLSPIGNLLCEKHANR